MKSYSDWVSMEKALLQKGPRIVWSQLHKKYVWIKATDYELGRSEKRKLTMFCNYLNRHSRPI